MRLLRLAVLGLAGYGGFTLWKRYGARVTGRASGNYAGDRRVNTRSELNVTEWAAGSDDPIAQAAAIIEDSDARSVLPRETPGVEHRRSEDTVEP
jgi:hypothetical protein